MLPLDKLLREGLQRFNLEKGVKLSRAVTLWGEVAGPAVAAVTHADTVRDGILIVFTRSSAWSQELSMLREPLIARINAELKMEAVTDIHFRVKRFRKSAAPEPQRSPARGLTDSEREEVAALSSRLEESLARKLSNVAERQMRGHAQDAVCGKCGGPVKDGETVCPFCESL